MTDISPDDIAGRFQVLLEKRGLKPGELARMAGVSAATVSHWLKGKNLTFDALALLCQQLHVSLDWLVSGNGCLELTNTRLTEMETVFIHTLRYIDRDIARPLQQMLDASLRFHRNRHTLAGHPGHQHIFQSGQTFHIVINGNGDIIKPDRHFYQLLGLDTGANHCDKPVNAYSLIAPDYLARARQALVRLQLTGSSQPLYLEVPHRQSGKRFGFLIQGALKMVDNELLTDTIIKPYKPESDAQ